MEQNCFRCINGIRRCNVAISRKDYIYAASMLNEAREFLIEIVIANEGVKTHQFKAFYSLDNSLQENIKQTFPKDITEQGIIQAKENLLKLLFKSVEANTSLTFNEKLWSVLSE